MFNRLSFLVLSLFFFSIFTAVTLNAQDVSKVSPKNYKVVIDNDKVQVLDNISNPGDKTPMHSHPDYLIYVLEGGTVKSTTQDGKSETIVFKKGQTLWRNAITHATQNVGKTKIHLLLVELKNPK
jgi:quercetin dioxygenase-like cupin family protein